jgi:hypothetical protein
MFTAAKPRSIQSLFVKLKSTDPSLYLFTITGLFADTVLFVGVLDFF